MSKHCPPAPIQKKEYITSIGKILVTEHGKQKHYTPKNVKEAHQKSKWHDTVDFSCWAMAFYCNHNDFDAYHASVEENCDYLAMKKEMVAGLSTDSNSPDLVLSSLEAASWLDFGDLFGGIFEGIGDVLSGIFDGL